MEILILAVGRYTDVRPMSGLDSQAHRQQPMLPHLSLRLECPALPCLMGALPALPACSLVPRPRTGPIYTETWPLRDCPTFAMGC